MSLTDTTQHPVQYDGKTHELYKIYLLSILLSILTLGIYHFWGKTRKRRYVTSSFILNNDRFEYTGYGSELLVGLLLGMTFLIISFTPLMWAAYELYHLPPQTISSDEDTSLQQENIKNKIVKKNKKPTPFYLSDPFGNRISFYFTNLTNFSIMFNAYGFSVVKEKEIIYLKWRGVNFDVAYEAGIQFNFVENLRILFAVILIPLYLLFYFVYLPYVIVYGSLRYRVSRLRFRGIRGHLEGSALVYGLIGLIHTLLKCVTLGFWIPIGDVITYKYKIKNLFFGNQRACYHPSIKTLINMNLATIGASLYLLALVAFCGYWLIPWLAGFIQPESKVIEVFSNKILRDGYYLFLILLVWMCYAPRYWYRAAFLREKYNNLRFGSIGFQCHASGFDYLKLFVINDLIFVLTLGLGLPFIWQRRMQFFCRHITIIGSMKDFEVEQAQGKKTRFGGGFASVMNLEIGLI